MDNTGEIQTYNASQGIAKERDLQLILWHTQSMRQARTGEIPGKLLEEIQDNDRKLNQVRALNLVISAQRELITISRSQIKFRSIMQWKRKYKEDQEQIDHPFDKFDCDYNKIIYLKEQLEACEQDIIAAEESPSLQDDFLMKKQKTDGEFFELTKNFYDMLRVLEDSYEDIHLLMLVNKIISAGIEENEELTYKEKEEEMKKRVLEA